MRKTLYLLTTVAALLAATITTKAAVTPPTPTTPGDTAWYYIYTSGRTYASGMVFTSGTDGGNLVASFPVTNSPAQLWCFVEQSAGVYAIRNKAGLKLEYKAGGTDYYIASSTSVDSFSLREGTGANLGHFILKGLHGVTSKGDLNKRNNNNTFCGYDNNTDDGNALRLVKATEPEAFVVLSTLSVAGNTNRPYLSTLTGTTYWPPYSQSWKVFGIGTSGTFAYSITGIDAADFNVVAGAGADATVLNNISVNFTGSAAKTYNASLEISGGGLTTPVSVPLTYTVTAPPFEVSTEENEHWYQLRFNRQASKSIQCNAVGANVTQVATASTTNQYWKFVLAGNNSFKVVSYSGYGLDGSTTAKAVAVGSAQTLEYAASVYGGVTYVGIRKPGGAFLNDQSAATLTYYNSAGTDAGNPMVLTVVSPAAELNVTGAAAAVFGTLAINRTYTASITVAARNIGYAETDTIAIAFTNLDGKFSLAPAAGWNKKRGGTLVVTYSPTADDEISAGTLVLTAGGNTETLTLSGTGTSKPFVLLAEESSLGSIPVAMNSLPKAVPVAATFLTQKGIAYTLTGADAAAFSLSKTGPDDSKYGTEGATFYLTDTLSVAFKPTEKRTYTAKLVAGNLDASDTLTLTGIGGDHPITVNQWGQFVFNSTGTALADKGTGVAVAADKTVDKTDSQLWRIVPSDTVGRYYLEGKSGGKLDYDGTSFVVNATGGKFDFNIRSSNLQIYSYTTKADLKVSGAAIASTGGTAADAAAALTYVLQGEKSKFVLPQLSNETSEYWYRIQVVRRAGNNTWVQQNGIGVNLSQVVKDRVATQFWKFVGTSYDDFKVVSKAGGEWAFVGDRYQATASGNSLKAVVDATGWQLQRVGETEDGINDNAGTALGEWYIDDAGNYLQVVPGIAELTHSSTSNGSISGIASGSLCDLNEAVVLTAVPTDNAATELVSWTEDGVDVGNSPSYTVTMSADKTITATFGPRSYTLDIAVNNASYGSVTGDTSGSYVYGTAIALTAKATDSTVFVSWVKTGTTEVVSTTAAYSLALKANTDVTANFKLILDKTTPGDTTWYYIYTSGRAYGSKTVLTSAADSGNIVVALPVKDNPAQLWSFVEQSKGVYAVINKAGLKLEYKTGTTDYYIASHTSVDSFSIREGTGANVGHFILTGLHGVASKGDLNKRNNNTTFCGYNSNTDDGNALRLVKATEPEAFAVLNTISATGNTNRPYISTLSVGRTPAALKVFGIGTAGKLTYTFTGADAAAFSIDSAATTDRGDTINTVTVKFAPTTKTTGTAVLEISGGGITRPTTVALTGTVPFLVSTAGDTTWYYIYTSGRAYAAGMVLTVDADSGNLIAASPVKNKPGQLWAFTEKSPNNFVIQNKAGLKLEYKAGETTDYYIASATSVDTFSVREGTSANLGHYILTGLHGVTGKGDINKRNTDNTFGGYNSGTDDGNALRFVAATEPTALAVVSTLSATGNTNRPYLTTLTGSVYWLPVVAPVKVLGIGTAGTYTYSIKGDDAASFSIAAGATTKADTLADLTVNFTGTDVKAHTASLEISGGGLLAPVSIPLTYTVAAAPFKVSTEESEYWYRLRFKRSVEQYSQDKSFHYNGAGASILQSATADVTAQYWKFVLVGNNTFKLVSYSGYAVSTGTTTGGSVTAVDFATAPALEYSVIQTNLHGIKLVGGNYLNDANRANLCYYSATGADGGNPLLIDTLATPALELNVTGSAAFGVLGTSRTYTANITVAARNLGNTDADTIAFALTSLDGRFSFAPAASWSKKRGGTLVVTYRPLVDAQLSTGTLVLTAGDSTATVELSGTGTIAPLINFSTSVLDFGNVTPGKWARSQTLDIEGVNLLAPLTYALKSGSNGFAIGKTQSGVVSGNGEVQDQLKVNFQAAAAANGVVVDTLLVSSGTVTEALPLTANVATIIPPVTLSEGANYHWYYLQSTVAAASLGGSIRNDFVTAQGAEADVQLRTASGTDDQLWAVLATDTTGEYILENKVSGKLKKGATNLIATAGAGEIFSIVADGSNWKIVRSADGSYLNKAQASSTASYLADDPINTNAVGTLFSFIDPTVVIVPKFSDASYDYWYHIIDKNGVAYVDGGTAAELESSSNPVNVAAISTNTNQYWQFVEGSKGGVKLQTFAGNQIYAYNNGGSTYLKMHTVAAPQGHNFGLEWTAQMGTDTAYNRWQFRNLDKQALGSGTGYYITLTREQWGLQTNHGFLLTPVADSALPAPVWTLSGAPNNALSFGTKYADGTSQTLGIGLAASNLPYPKVLQYEITEGAANFAVSVDSTWNVTHGGTLNVTYTAANGTNATHTGTLRLVRGTALGDTLTVALSGRSVSGAYVTALPRILNVGNIPAGVNSLPQTVTVAGLLNTKDATYTLAGTDAAAFALSKTTAEADKYTGTDLVDALTVVFKPTELRAYSAQLVVNSTEAKDTILLTGTGVEHPVPVNQWGQILFSSTGTALTDKGTGVAVAVENAVDRADNQQWSIVPSDTVGQYYLVGKSGAKLDYTGGTVVVSATGGKFDLAIRGVNLQIYSYAAAGDLKVNGAAVDVAPGAAVNAAAAISYLLPGSKNKFVLPLLSTGTNEYWYRLQFVRRAEADKWVQNSGGGTNLAQVVKERTAEQFWKFAGTSYDNFKIVSKAVGDWTLVGENFQPSSSGDYIKVVVNATGWQLQRVAGDANDGINDLSGTALCEYTLGDAGNYVQVVPGIAELTYTAPGGTVTGIASGSLCDLNEVVTLTAVPQLGYTFVSWTDAANAVLSTDSAYTFTMAANLTLKANFDGAPLSTDATLQSLVVKANDLALALTPAFSAAVTAYTLTVPYATTSLAVEAAANHAAATLTGTGSQTFAATETQKLLTVAVTAQNGATTTYTVNVTRASAPPVGASDDATLQSLAVRVDGTLQALTPDFSTTVTAYTLTVPTATTAITIEAVANHAAATVAGAGSQNFPANAQEFPFPVTVLAEDGTTTKVYTITVTRESPATASTDATLQSLVVKVGTEVQTLTPAFSAAQLSYSLTVPSTTTAVTIEAAVNYPAATVTGDGSQPFAVGETQKQLTVTVTAEDGTTTKAYTITLNRATTGILTGSILPLQVYPNPVTNGQLTIANGQLKAGEKVEVYSAQGVLVGAYTTATINISHLPAGTYLVKVGNRVAKIVK